MLNRDAILTVGRTPGCIQSRGAIDFFVEQNKVKLKIHLDAAARLRVKIVPKLIAVARLASASTQK